MMCRVMTASVAEQSVLSTEPCIALSASSSRGTGSSFTYCDPALADNTCITCALLAILLLLLCAVLRS
jgi:hypothetical protein